MKGKKGDVSDGIIFVVIIFFLAVSLVIVAFVNSKFSYIVKNTVLNESAAASDIAAGLDNMTDHSIQRAFVILFAFMIIGMMISSFMVRVHPVWIFLYILFLGIAVILAVPLANIYSEIVNNSVLNEVASKQTAITYVMQHSIQILIGAVALSMIVLFAKIPERSQI